MSGTGNNRADTWLGLTAPNAQRGNTERRDFDTVRRIDERSSAIVITRRDEATRTNYQLAPQMVRLEVAQNPRTSSDQRDVAMDVSKQYVVVIGDVTLDIQRADRWFYHNRMYIVNEIIDTVPGRMLISVELRP